MPEVNKMANAAPDDARKILLAATKAASVILADADKKAKNRALAAEKRQAPL